MIYELELMKLERLEAINDRQREEFYQLCVDAMTATGAAKRLPIYSPNTGERIPNQYHLQVLK